eukprot:873331-Pyramimonas_sp.AAC.1
MATLPRPSAAHCDSGMGALGTGTALTRSALTSSLPLRGPLLGQNLLGSLGFRWPVGTPSEPPRVAR